MTCRAFLSSLQNEFIPESSKIEQITIKAQLLNIETYINIQLNLKVNERVKCKFENKNHLKFQLLTDGYEQAWQFYNKEGLRVGVGGPIRVAMLYIPEAKSEGKSTKILHTAMTVCINPSSAKQKLQQTAF